MRLKLKTKSVHLYLHSLQFKIILIKPLYFKLKETNEFQLIKQLNNQFR